MAQVAKPHEWTGSQFNTLAHYGFADYPDGLLRSNVSDLANFMIAFLQQGTFSGNQLLSSASVGEMLSAQASDDGGVMGLNWYQEEVFLEDGGTVMMWGHNGGETGVSTDLYINPQNGIGVAVLNNGEGDNLYVVDELYNYALSLTPSGAGNPPCQSVSIAEAVAVNEWKLYPNPTTGVVTLSSDFADPRIRLVEVYDMQGRKVLDALTNSSTSIDISELPSGVYSLRLILADRSSAVAKVVLMR